VAWEVTKKEYEKLRAQYATFCGCDT